MMKFNIKINKDLCRGIAIGILIGILIPLVFKQAGRFKISEFFKFKKKEVVVAPEVQKEYDTVTTGLPPATFTEDMPPEFETTTPGEFKVSWVPVDGAERTRVYILDQQGNEIKTNSSKRLTVLYIKDISLGENESIVYDVRLASIDGQGKRGPYSPVRKLTVSRLSGQKLTRLQQLQQEEAELPDETDQLVAPAVRSITIEDE